jgi:tryptophan-rich sensory protein
MRNWLRLILSILICESAGLLGSIFTVSAIPTWYATLNKPPFNPPNWLFGPVWTLLYLLMGIALYLVWKKGWKRKDVKIALGVFFIQLLLNASWSIVFFGAQQILAAFIVIILMWIAILASIFLFYRISKAAAYLLIPYILWVSFAGVLNYSLLILN